MIYGVTINDINTLTRWNLALAADLYIEDPQPRTVFITIPSQSGAISAGYAASGGNPVFGMRKITFSLIALGADDSRLIEIRRELFTEFAGKECKIILPNDNAHYYKGVVSIISSSGYAAGTLGISINAYPYIYDVETDAGVLG